VPPCPYFREKYATVEIVQHIRDNDLEKFAMQTLPEPGAGPLERHLLICGEFRERMDSEIEYVKAMRGAAAKIRYQELS